MDGSRRVLVLIDPSIAGGAVALDLAATRRQSDLGSLTVVATLSGPAADPFRRLAESEGMRVAEAAGVHLSRVTAGLAARGIPARGLSVPGLDVVVELATCAVEVSADAVVVPAESGIIDAAQSGALATLAGVPVLRVPALPHHPGRRAA